MQRHWFYVDYGAWLAKTVLLQLKRVKMADQMWIKASRSCGCLHVMQTVATAIGIELQSF